MFKDKFSVVAIKASLVKRVSETLKPLLAVVHLQEEEDSQVKVHQEVEGVEVEVEVEVMALPVIMVMNHLEEQAIKVDFPVKMLLALVEDPLEEDHLMILDIPLVKYAVLHQLDLGDSTELPLNILMSQLHEPWVNSILIEN